MFALYHELFSMTGVKISAQPHTTLCIQLLDREKTMTKTIHFHWENGFVLQ